MAVGVGIVAKGDVESVLEHDQPSHGERTRTVHADFAVVIEGHESEGRIHAVVHQREVQSVALGDRFPQRKRGAAEGIDSDAEAGLADGFHVDDGSEICHVGRGEIVSNRRGGGAGLRGGHALHLAIPTGQQFVGPLFDPAGDIGIGGASVGGVVFESAVLRRVVGRRDDQAIGQARGSAVVVSEDGVGNHRSGGGTVVRSDARFHAVRGEDFERGLFGDGGGSVGVAAHEQRSAISLSLAEFDDGLGDRGNVGVVERALQRISPVPARAEGNALGGIGEIGLDRGVGPFEGGDIDQRFAGRGFSGKRMRGHWLEASAAAVREPSREEARNIMVDSGLSAARWRPPSCRSGARAEW